jgi:hypothetical protein
VTKHFAWLTCITINLTDALCLFCFSAFDHLGRLPWASYFQTKLDPGPHKVGFKAGVHFDIGRPPLKEQFAAYRGGRAVHISVWYPAKPKNNHPRMMYAEYVDECRE